MVFDPSKSSVISRDLGRKDWRYLEFSRKIKKKRELSPRNLTPRGMGLIIVRKLDSYHGGGKLMRQSRTGFSVHLHSALVNWHSKKQNGVESFCSKFVYVKQSCEHV